MNALSMAWPLSRDEDLRQRIAHHLTCYLKRLQRIEIVHLQQNPALLFSWSQFFHAGELVLDPGDIDLTKTDRIVAYVQRRIDPANEATFDRSCPETVLLQPWWVIDAAGEYFVADFLERVQDMDTSAGNENQIDHYYFPSIRGGDVIHLMHLAAMAHWFTGEEQFRSGLAPAAEPLRVGPGRRHGGGRPDAGSRPLRGLWEGPPLRPPDRGSRTGPGLADRRDL